MLDPMCGSGSLGLEVMYSHPDAFSVNADFEGSEARRCGRNILHLKTVVAERAEASKRKDKSQQQAGASDVTGAPATVAVAGAGAGTCAAAAAASIIAPDDISARPSGASHVAMNADKKKEIDRLRSQIGGMKSELDSLKGSLVGLTQVGVFQNPCSNNFGSGRVRVCCGFLFFPFLFCSPQCSSLLLKSLSNFQEFSSAMAALSMMLGAPPPPPPISAAITHAMQPRVEATPTENMDVHEENGNDGDNDAKLTKKNKKNKKPDNDIGAKAAKKNSKPKNPDTGKKDGNDGKGKKDDEDDDDDVANDDDDEGMEDIAAPLVAGSSFTLKHAVVDVAQTDVRHLPFKAESIDVILTDLPFGKLVGSHQENR